MKMTLFNEKGGETTVEVVRENEKAILVAGGCSEAWFPKSALTILGVNEVTGHTVADVAPWFTGTLVHTFLWIAPIN
jgi:hypothetical protein